MLHARHETEVRDLRRHNKTRYCKEALPWTCSSLADAMTIDDPTSPPARYTTAREILAGGHRVDVWCPRCRTWREISLASILRIGRGDESLIGRTWRCRVCAEVAQMHVRPKVAEPQGTTLLWTLR